MSWMILLKLKYVQNVHWMRLSRRWFCFWTQDNTSHFTQPNVVSPAHISVFCTVLFRHKCFKTLKINTHEDITTIFLKIPTNECYLCIKTKNIWIVPRVTMISILFLFLIFLILKSSASQLTMKFIFIKYRKELFSLVQDIGKLIEHTKSKGLIFNVQKN